MKDTGKDRRDRKTKKKTVIRHWMILKKREDIGALKRKH
jgi:hypothetical protein